jgi:hypothetical protein
LGLVLMAACSLVAPTPWVVAMALVAGVLMVVMFNGAAAIDAWRAVRAVRAVGPVRWYRRGWVTVLAMLACGRTEPLRYLSDYDPNALDGGAGDAWRRHLTAIRKAAIRLAVAGQIEILRKGKPAPPVDIKGVIRLRRVETA